jgi:YgiT-type zinc finger domain-containing protein
VDVDLRTEAPAICNLCGDGELRPTRVRSAFWEGDRLVVVEDIPALVCSSCGEQLFDDVTAIRLDLLRGAGFPGEMSCGELRVPVFSLEPSPGEGE